ncbi:MAG: CarD family transcriptional regulator [Eubacteriaceae bacterium]|nr:CarD family transcriptional regulator [Eubacteriaceae bacterium]
MFCVDDYVVYSNTGVCKVVAVGTLEGFEEGLIYYTLKPVTRPETVFIPVDADVYVRKVISREEALELVDRIPTIKEDTATSGMDPRSLGEYYKKKMATHQSDELIRMIKTIYSKGQRLARNGKKLIKTDADYKKKAEDILYNELAIALDIPPGEIEDFICTRLGTTAAMEDA